MLTISREINGGGGGGWGGGSKGWRKSKRKHFERKTLARENENKNKKLSHKTFRGGGGGASFRLLTHKQRKNSMANALLGNTDVKSRFQKRFYEKVT